MPRPLPLYFLCGQSLAIAQSCEKSVKRRSTLCLLYIQRRKVPRAELEAEPEYLEDMSSNLIPVKYLFAFCTDVGWDHDASPNAGDS